MDRSCSSRTYIAGGQGTSEDTKTIIDHVDASPYFKNNVREAAKEKKKISLSNKKDDIFYNTHHKKRGPAVVFNHKYFNDDLKIEPRMATEEDCESLKQTLHNLGFEVQIHDDLEFKQLDNELEKLRTNDFSDCDCLLICVLSHGLREEMIYAKDVLYHSSILFNRFTSDCCPTLAGKPKLFLIQACRGKVLDDGIDVEPDSGGHAYRIPLCADFLTAYSTIPGYCSWWNEENGSWFIQAFCDEMNKHHMESDFTSILTSVNRRVAYEFESYVPNISSMHRRKQIPCFATRLTRLLRFTSEHFENTGVQLQVYGPEVEPTIDATDALLDFMRKKCQVNTVTPKITISNKKEDVFYNTRHKRRGLAVVFNHKMFHNDLRLKARMGTEKDCESLNQTWKNLGFEVQIHDDLEFEQLDDELEKLRISDFSDCDCLLICILSHGLESEKIYATDRTYSTDTLFKRFTPDCCPTLAGKPKLFLIQACRGARLDDGVDVEVAGIGDGQTMYRIPSYADFLIAYSTAPEYVSWRSKTDGSWFIQTFCKEVDKNWHKYDLVKILNFVNRTVAIEFESYVSLDPHSSHKKEIPVIVVMLTRLLRF